MKNKHLGFTLIEILVVLMIIGITIGMTLLSFGDFGASRRLTMEAEQLINIIKLAQEQAILESATLGLDFTQNSYQLFRFTPPSVWSPITNRNIFRIHYFPKNTRLSLKTNHRTVRGVPEVIINAAGDLTPFTLDLGNNSNPVIVQLQGMHNGNLSLKQVEK